MAFGRREGFISAYLFGSQSTLKGSQGKNSRKKPGYRNWSRNHGVLLIGFLLMAWSASFLKATRATSLRLAPPKWAVSYYINHQSRNCTTGQFYGGIISLGVICSQMTPTCIKYMYKIDIKLPSYLQTSFSAFSMCIAIEPFIVHAQPCTLYMYMQEAATIRQQTWFCSKSHQLPTAPQLSMSPSNVYYGILAGLIMCRSVHSVTTAIISCMQCPGHICKMRLLYFGSKQLLPLRIFPLLL